MDPTRPINALPLPAGIRSSRVYNGNGLSMHVLEAGFETPGQPCVLLLHGFPELAYSWRKVMLPLASAGYHVVAPDQRGYGRTTGWRQGWQAGLDEFRMLNLVRDALGLIAALGHTEVAAVVGHDFGSPVAAWCALLRPDVFRSVALMSAPFGGPPPLPLGTAASAGKPIGLSSIALMLDGLAALDPPRKHYQWYYSTPEANDDMLHAPQGTCLSARLLPSKKRGLAAQRATTARGVRPGGAGEATTLLRDGRRQDHGRDRGRRNAVTRTGRGLSLAS